jgi:hypothetical protein
MHDLRIIRTKQHAHAARLNQHPSYLPRVTLRACPQELLVAPTAAPGGQLLVYQVRTYNLAAGSP